MLGWSTRQAYKAIPSDYNPFEISLFSNWLFDSYAQDDEGGDTLIDLLTNFKKKILEDKNFQEIFRKEIQSKSSDEIMDRLNKLIDRKFLVDKLFELKLLEKNTKNMANGGFEKEYEYQVRNFFSTETRKTKTLEDNTLNIYKQITKELNLEKYEEFAYPIGVKTSGGGHAIGTYFKKINDNKFLFYVINAGAGAGYQNINNKQTHNSGIQCFEIDKTKLDFIYSILFSSHNFLTIEAFYNVVLRILFTDEEHFFEYDEFKDKQLCESPLFKKNINLKLQVMGNCTVVSLVNVIEIILREDDDLSTNNQFEVSKEFLALYNQVKIVLLYYFAGFFVNLKNDYLKNTNYNLFIKLNESYLLIKDSEYRNTDYDNNNDILMKTLYEFYMNDIEDFTDIKGINFKNYEKLCNEIKKINKLEKNPSFNKDFLKQASFIDKIKMRKIDEDLDSLFIDLSVEKIDDIDNFEKIERFLKVMCDYVNIIKLVSENTEDFVRSRYRQYMLLNIIKKLYVKIGTMIESKDLDIKYDITNIVSILDEIGSVFDNLNINYYNYYDYPRDNDYSLKKENYDYDDVLFNKYKLTIYDTFVIYLILITGRVNDYICDNKVEEYEFSKTYLEGALSSLFSNFIINNREEYNLITELIAETVKYNKYLVFVREDSPVFIPNAPPNLRTAAAVGHHPKHELDLDEIVNGSSFKFTTTKFIHKIDQMSTNYGFYGRIPLHNFSNLFRQELLDKKFKTIPEYFNYIENNLKNPKDINWLLPKLNIILYKCILSETNFTLKMEEINELDKETKLANFNIYLINKIDLEKNKNSLFINELVKNIDDYFYDRTVKNIYHSGKKEKNFITLNTGEHLNLSYMHDEFTIKFKPHLLLYTPFFNVDTDNILDRENFVKANLILNESIYNKGFFENIINEIGYIIKNNLVHIEYYESLFNIIISIINLFNILDIKFDLSNESLKRNLEIISNEFSIIIKFLLKEYHDLDIKYDENELIDYLDKIIKFNKTLFIYTNIDTLINLVFVKVSENDKLKKCLFDNDNFKKIIIKTDKDYNYKYEVDPSTTYNFYNNNFKLNNLGSLEIVDKISKYKTIDNNKEIRIHYSENLNIQMESYGLLSLGGPISGLMRSDVPNVDYTTIINYSHVKTNLFSEREKLNKKKVSATNINIEINNFNFNYEHVNNYYYDYYQRKYYSNYIGNQVKIYTKEVYFGENNSLLQIYYKPEYSFLVDADYIYENMSDPSTHIATKNNELIKITLNDDNVIITIDGNRVLMLSDILKNDKICEIYIKLMKLLNMNLDDLFCLDDKELKRESLVRSINEIIPIKIGNKIKFECKEKKIYFMYDLKTNILTYMDQDEIIINKNYYFANRYIYNTDCMIMKQKNNKFSIILMGKYNTSINFVKINYNGIFSESNVESVISLIKQQLNGGCTQEANLVALNLIQNKLAFSKQINNKPIKLEVSKFSNLKSIYFNYFNHILSGFAKVYSNGVSVSSKINMNQIEYFNYFKYDLINDTNLTIENKSLITCNVLSTKGKGTIFNIDKTKSITRALYIKYVALINDYDISLDNNTPKIIYDSIDSYDYYEKKYIEHNKFHIDYKIHKNKKVTITNDEWDYGPNIFENININNVLNDKFYKEEIDTSFFTNSKTLLDEYKEDSSNIIKDYDDFYKDEISKIRNIINIDELEKLLENIKKALILKISRFNEINKLQNLERFENINNLDIIINFNYKYMNEVMLLNKYSMLIEEIISLLTTPKENYDISKLMIATISKPIFIDNLTNSYLVCFEYLFGNHIRQKQLNFANNLYDELLLKDKEGPNLHQLLMGEGKSSVIAPILTLNLLGNNEMNKESIIYHVMPVSLVNQSYDIFNKIFFYLDRNLLRVIENKSDLDKLFMNKIVILSDYLLKYAKVTSNNIKEFDMCKNIFIYDEVDEVSDPLKSQLNIISSKPRKIDNSEIIFAFIHDFIYNLYFNPECDIIRTELQKYQFNLIPHLINQNVDIYIKAKNIISDLFLESIRETLGINYLDAYNELINKKNLAYNFEKIDLNIINFLYSFNNLIPNIVSQLHRRHFGLKFNDLKDISILTNQKTLEKYSLSEINKLFIAVPFVSNETPSDKSEFSDHLYTIALTIICYYEKSVRRIRNVDIQIYLNHLIELYNLDKFKKIEKNRGIRLFNILTEGMQIKDRPNFSDKLNIMDFNESDILIVVNNFPIKYYLLNILLPKIIRVNDDYKNISFIDIIKSSFSPHRIGFTGTPFIHKPLEYKSETELKYICKQLLGDGAIVGSIVGFTRKAELFTGINNKEEIMDIAVNNKYHCIIDVGSYFINDETDEIAKTILNKLKSKGSNIKCVVYINKEHKKLGLLHDDRIIPYDSINLPLKDRFYFYDQSHITGIDMKIYSEAKGLITLSSFNRYRDVAQGIFRLRNINNGQTVDFCSNDNFKRNLDNNSINLINFLIYNEFRYKLSQSSLFYKQNILTLYRTYFEDNDIYNLPDIDKNFSYLSSNIYKQSYKINNITEVEDITIDLLKLYKKQIDEVTKCITDNDLCDMISELLKYVDIDIGNSTVESEGEELGLEEPESQDIAIEQPVEQPIEEAIIENYSNDVHVIKIQKIPVENFFVYGKFDYNDIIDIDFSPKITGEFKGFIPSTARTEKDSHYSIPTIRNPASSGLSWGVGTPTSIEGSPLPFMPSRMPVFKPAVSSDVEVAEEDGTDKKKEEVPLIDITKIIPELPKIEYPENYYADPTSYLQSHDRYAGYHSMYTPAVISRYVFKHIINNIFVPSINIEYKTKIDFSTYGDTFNYLEFNVDSFIEIFNNDKESTNYGKLNHVILIKNNQAIKMINKIKDTDKLIRFRTLSGFIYYESNLEINKRYPEDYDNTTLNLILLLLKSNKITNLNLVLLLDELQLCSSDLLNKFRIKESPISSLFGIFTKKDFYNVMLFTKLVSDYNVFLEGKTEIYNEKQISSLIEKIKENISRCSNDSTITRYKAIFEDEDFMQKTLPKFGLFFRRFISLKTDNILKYIHYAKDKIEIMWDLVKIVYSYEKEYRDTSC
jgi:hypothetical protein